MASQLLFPLQFKRQYAGPIESDIVFTSTTSLNTYLSSALRYAGQIATNLEDEGAIYIMSNDLTKWIKFNGGSEEVTPDDSPIWNSGTTYTAGEFVSYVNPLSSDPQFQINYIYVAQTTITAGVSPEDDQINWLWAGDSLTVESDTANGAVANNNAIRQITNYKIGHSLINIEKGYIYKVVDNQSNVPDDDENIIKPNDVELSAATRWQKFFDLNTSLNAYKITNLFANKHTYNSLSGQSSIVIGNYDNYEIFINGGAATLVPTFASTIPTYGERLCVVTNQKATSITIQLPTLNHTDGRQYIGNVATISINQNESVELHYLFLPTTIRIVAQKYTYRSS